MRATTRPILAVFLVVLTVLATAASAIARPSAGIDWQPCPDDDTAHCGTLSVPANWDDPYSPRIKLAIARRPATDPAHRLGALIVNPGGPGGSGVDFALGADAFFSEKVRARFDIVGFDPRGVGRSAPVTCSSAVVEAGPQPLITSAAEFDRMVAFNRRLAANCRARSGPAFTHLDTLSVVRDTDAVRAALGESKLTFYGASYGTLLGAQYAERYPKRVRAIVLDSVLDHSASLEEFLGIESAAVQDAFDEFVAWCARDASCVLKSQDIPAIWARLLVRARAGTLLDPYNAAHRMTVYDLLQVAFSSFYDPQWYTLAFYLKNADSAVAAVAREAGPLTVEHSFPAVFCSDWAFPLHTYADLAKLMSTVRARAPQMIASPLGLTAAFGCLGWPGPPGDPQAPIGPVTTPILLVSARHDPATAYAWAQRVAAALGPAARLLTYEGWGHVAYGRTDCVTSLVDAYLIEGRTPAAGASCPGVVPPPFGVGKRGVSLAKLTTGFAFPRVGAAVESPRPESVHRP